MNKLLVWRSILCICIASLAIVGTGCSKKPTGAILEEGSRRPSVAPPNPWREYERAGTIDHASVRVYLDEEDDRQISLRIPEGWSGNGPVWRPKDDDVINHIRIQYFGNTGPEGEFLKQQGADVHDVIHAEALDDRFVLLVNHPVLKASILKFFMLDPQRPGKAFYFVECRVGYDADRPVLWDECKTAINSLDMRPVSVTKSDVTAESP